MPINSPTLNVPKGTNGIAIAIYQEPAHARLSGFDPNRYASWQWVDHGTMVDGGPHPWNPFVNQLIAGVALANASRGFDEQVRGDLVKVGLQQIKLAAAAIEKSIRTSTKM
jgi:hypothetical protein